MKIWPKLAAASDVSRIDIGSDPFEFASSACVELLEALRKVTPSDGAGNAQLYFPRLGIIAFYLSEDERDHDWINSIVNVACAREALSIPLNEILVPDHAMQWPIWSDLLTNVRVTPMQRL